MNLSRRNFMKIAGLSAAYEDRRSVRCCCCRCRPVHRLLRLRSAQLPVRFSATVIGKDIQKALDTKQWSVGANLSQNAQKDFINAHVRSQFPMYEVESIERKTDTLDGKETDYLYVTLKTS